MNSTRPSTRRWPSVASLWTYLLGRRALSRKISSASEYKPRRSASSSSKSVPVSSASAIAPANSFPSRESRSPSWHACARCRPALKEIFAGANDYVFEPVKAEVKKGDEVVVSVRLAQRSAAPHHILTGNRLRGSIIPSNTP